MSRAAFLWSSLLIALLLTVLAVMQSTSAFSLAEDVWSHWPDVLLQGMQHIRLSLISGILAVITAIPIGITLSRPRFATAASFAMRCLGVTSTVPVLAILGLLSVIIGIGNTPAIVALYVATVMPIVRNTYQGLAGVPAVFLEAAAGIGMSPMQCLFKVELPAAMYVIFDGIRIAMVINVGTAPLAFLIGGGGLGDLIFTGIALNDTASMLAGAIPVAALAILIDASLASLSNVMTSVGTKHHYQSA